jgi:hypothetical protein
MAFTAPSQDIEKMRPSEGEALSFTAGEEVVAGQVVKLTGDLSVAPCDTAGESSIGVVTQSVPSGDTCMVVGNSGRVLFTAGSSVSAGDPLTVDPSTNEGEVGTANSTGDVIVGYALESAGAQETLRGVVDRGGEVN